jgi:succinate dehydrogenase (ubiquinone) flavoprotein subunit
MKIILKLKFFFPIYSILASSKPGDPVAELSATAGESSIANADNLRTNASGDISTAELRLTLQKTMQKHAAVFRRGDVLQVFFLLFKKIFKIFAVFIYFQL